MATLTQMRARFREILKLGDITDVDEGDPPQAVITKLLNEAIERRWAQLCTSYPRRLLTRTTMTYTANTRSVSLPAAARGRMVGYVQILPQNSTDQLKGIDLMEAGILELDNYPDTGTPEVFAIDMIAQEIQLRPAPTWAATLYIGHVAAPTALVSNSDTISTIPAEFHQLFVYDAVACYKAEAGDPDAYPAQQRADAIYENLKRYVERHYGDNHFKKNRPIGRI
ncbi:MAG TPA: hypothetical protein PLC19_00160 [Marmoricola sp.]|nr:hypothetical protein [Marmoricola sp.]